MSRHSRRYEWLLLLALLWLRPAIAAEIDLRFESANQAYRATDYRRAAALYEEILAQGYESAALYYNLGNCYYKLNNIPASVLHFERALKLDPDDEDIAYNLNLANLRVVDRIEPIPEMFYVAWWRKWADLASADRWAALAIAALWGALVACFAVYLPYRLLLLQRLFAALALLSTILFVLSITASVDRHRREHTQKYAIVFAPTTNARSAPDEQSTGLFVLHEGVKVELLDRVGEWSKIRLADGKVGWIPAASFQLI